MIIDIVIYIVIGTIITAMVQNKIEDSNGTSLDALSQLLFTLFWPIFILIGIIQLGLDAIDF